MKRVFSGHDVYNSQMLREEPRMKDAGETYAKDNNSYIYLPIYTWFQVTNTNINILLYSSSSSPAKDNCISTVIVIYHFIHGTK